MVELYKLFKWIWLLGGVILLVSCGSQQPLTAQQELAIVQREPQAGPAKDLVQPVVIKIPINAAGLFGGEIGMVTHLYRPPGDGPFPVAFPVVVFSHGRGNIEQRQALKSPVLVGHANFWLRKGFAVVASIRPGYGETGGVDREDAGHRWRNFSCLGDPDFANTARIAGAAIRADLDWLRSQPWVRNDKILLVGQSVGGLATVGVGAENPSGVVGYINFSGGAGGSPDASPSRSCMPERLTTLYGEFGKTTKIPSLWLYAENDLYWGAYAPEEWHKAFSAGGSKTRFVMTPPVPGVADGHRLLAAGGRLWSPHVNRFVKELGF
jgi:dienelactone hydrolase